MRIIFLGILSILFCVACSEQHDQNENLIQNPGY